MPDRCGRGADCKSVVEQLVRLSRGLKDSAKDFVTVRVVNMLGLDISTLVCDYGLTYAILLMNADGRLPTAICSFVFSPYQPSIIAASFVPEAHA